MSSDNGHLVIHCEPIAVDRAEAARLIGISDRHWRKLLAEDRVPAPIRLGRRTLWAVAELRAWTAAGCPCRETWEEVQRQQR